MLCLCSSTLHLCRRPINNLPIQSFGDHGTAAKWLVYREDVKWVKILKTNKLKLTQSSDSDWAILQASAQQVMVFCEVSVEQPSIRLRWSKHRAMISWLSPRDPSMKKNVARWINNRISMTTKLLTTFPSIQINSPPTVKENGLARVYFRSP